MFLGNVDFKPTAANSFFAHVIFGISLRFKRSTVQVRLLEVMVSTSPAMLGATATPWRSGHLHEGKPRNSFAGGRTVSATAIPVASCSSISSEDKSCSDRGRAEFALKRAQHRRQNLHRERRARTTWISPCVPTAAARAFSRVIGMCRTARASVKKVSPPRQPQRLSLRSNIESRFRLRGSRSAAQARL